MGSRAKVLSKNPRGQVISFENCRLNTHRQTQQIDCTIPRTEIVQHLPLYRKTFIRGRTDHFAVDVPYLRFLFQVYVNTLINDYSSKFVNITPTRSIGYFHL